jgi:hypothetical protein
MRGPGGQGRGQGLHALANWCLQGKKIIEILEIEQQKQATTDKMMLVVVGQDIAPHKHALLAFPTHK